MEEKYRSKFNSEYTHEKYQTLLDKVNTGFGKAATFRIAETPIFIPNQLRDQLIEACDLLNDYILSDDFVKDSNNALSKLGIHVPNENAHTTFIQYDFGITTDKDGNLTPRLIEMQGFPSLYCFQHLLEKSFRSTFDLSDNLSPFFNNFDHDSYNEHMRQLLAGNDDPRYTVLLEIDPDLQNTAIDFYGCHQMFGIKILNLMDLKKEGRNLYYIENNEKIPVRRIYNRVIFDELAKRTDLQPEFRFEDEVDVEWIGHPHWFFKISKYTMPFIKNNPYIPSTYFLNTIGQIPEDLQNYVLKPLFSFSGEGVKFHVTKEDIDAIDDPENWILQEKVNYIPAIKSLDPNEPIKCEIRMMHTWMPDDKKPVLINNLVRLSKGEMIGVKYNKDKEWIGASFGLFEKTN